MRAERSLVGVLLWCLAWVSMVPGTCRAEPPGKDEPEEPKKLNVLIEKSVNWLPLTTKVIAALITGLESSWS